MRKGLLNREKDDEVLELSFIPLIDFFTVLIAFLLASASYFAFDVVEASVAREATIETGVPVSPSAPTVNATVLSDGRVLFEVNAKGKVAHLEALSNAIQLRGEEIRKRWPASAEVNVRAQPNTSFVVIARAVDDLKKQFTKVFLGE